MKQVLVRGGGVVVEDVPAPAVVAAIDPRARRTTPASSVGTEMIGVQYVRAAALPARAQAAPPREARPRDRTRRGLRARLQARRGHARGRPSHRLLGRRASSSRSATRWSGFRAGDRVACAGAGIANHAEMIVVPVNLAVRVPDGLELETRRHRDPRRDRAAGRAPDEPDARRDGRP